MQSATEFPPWAQSLSQDTSLCDVEAPGKSRQRERLSHDIGKRDQEQVNFMLPRALLQPKRRSRPTWKSPGLT